MDQLDPELLLRNSQAVAKAQPLYEKINRNWELAEALFREQGILRPVYLDISDGYSSNPSFLAIHKHGGKWRIGIFHHGFNDVDDSFDPIVECSIESRLSLFKQIPALFAALVASNEKYIPELEAAVVATSKLLDSLRTK